MPIVYNVFVNHSDPDDPNYYEYVGHRATLAGAQTLAEKKLGKKIYSFFRRGDSMGKAILFTGTESDRGKQAKILYDHAWGPASGSRDPSKGKIMRKHHHAAVRIPKAKRAATSRRVRELVSAGYSPSYAARKAYHGRDPEGAEPRIIGISQRPEGTQYKVSLHDKKGRKDVVTVLVHHNGARSTTSAIRSTSTPFHAQRAVDRYLAADTIERERMRGTSRDVHHLTAAERRHLKPTQFALPARRALPIEDAAHVRAAASRLEQMRHRGTITLGEYRAAREKIRAAAKRFGVHLSF